MELGEGRHRFHGPDLTTDRRGVPYYLKPVTPERWARDGVPEWTAAMDDDPAEDD